MNFRSKIREMKEGTALSRVWEKQMLSGLGNMIAHLAKLLAGSFFVLSLLHFLYFSEIEILD